MSRQHSSPRVNAGIINIQTYNKNRRANRYAIKNFSEQQRQVLFDGATNGIPERLVNMFIHTVEDNDQIPHRINSGYKKSDMALLLLFYLVQHHYCTYKYMKTVFGVAKSQVVKIFIKLLPGLVAFIQEHIQFGTFAQRKATTEAHMPEPFKSYTGILDGVHILLKNIVLKNGQSVFRKGSFGSHKFGYKPAASFQVVIDASGICILCDDGNPAGVHDYKCLWRSKFDNKLVFGQDRILADLGYMGKRIRINILTPHKGTTLTPAQREFNKQISNVRVRVEHFFGIAKGRFDFLREYRGPLHLLPIFVKFAFAMTNLIVSTDKVSEEEKQAAYLQFCAEHSGEDVDCADQNLEPCVYQGRIRRFEDETDIEQMNWEDSTHC